MKILAVSDYEEPYIWDYFDKDRFRDVEMIISCGDLKAEYLSFLVTMVNVPLFYVAGNHDTPYRQSPPEGCISIDDKLEIYKGVRMIGLGGSHRYNSNDFQYTEKQMLHRIRRLKRSITRNDGFDILVTHAPAAGISEGQDICHKGFKGFIDLMDKYSPKYFIHGHQHLTYIPGKQRTTVYKSTKVVNAYGYHIFDYA